MKKFYVLKYEDNWADEMDIEAFVILNEEDKKLFLEDLGISESGLDKLIKATYSLLGLATYFTAGVKEVRAWTFRKGMRAPECAGIIHSDFERGFIRAEVISFIFSIKNAPHPIGRRGVIFFTRYHPDLRISSMRLHWACIGAYRHGLNVLAHACSRAMFSRAAPPLSTIRGSLWTRPSGYSPLPGIYRLSYDFPKEMSRKNSSLPIAFCSAIMHFDTTSRGASSLRSGSYLCIKRSLLPLRRYAPSPLTASETKKHSRFFLSAKAVGWN